MDIRMELSRILIREVVDHQIIELREADPEPGDEPRTFPIVIGLPEAQAIERRLKGIEIRRPQTHDLLANLLDALSADLESIAIHDLSEHTFFATLRIIRENGDLVEVDSRPSDAIAIGIAGEVPIYVAEHVLDAASQDPT
jgi:bifunctional DNase/RNase